MEDSMMVSHKIKNRIDPAIQLLDLYTKIIESRMSKSYFHSKVHSSQVHNSQEMEAPQMSTERWMDKQNKVYT